MQITMTTDDSSGFLSNDDNLFGFLSDDASLFAPSAPRGLAHVTTSLPAVKVEPMSSRTSIIDVIERPLVVTTPLPVVEVDPMSCTSVIAPVVVPCGILRPLVVEDDEPTAFVLHLNRKSSPPPDRACASPTHITDALLTPVSSKHAKPRARRFKPHVVSPTSIPDTDVVSALTSKQEVSSDRKQRKRDSAAESRKRKRSQLQDLEALAATLKSDVADLMAQNAELRRECALAGGRAEGMQPPQPVADDLA